MPDDPTLLVSFTIRPRSGSEAGVGWAFLEAQLQRGSGVVHLLLDARDEHAVQAGLADADPAGRVVLHPVAVPDWALNRYGDRRTRESYLAWLPAARRRLRAVAAEARPVAAHQATFASAVLPPVLRRGVAARTVWGPLAVPVSAAGGAGRVAPIGAAAVQVAQAVAARNLKSADLVVANNDHTRAFIEARGARAAVEPNIVVERVTHRAGPVDAAQLVMAGHLLTRKRPWLAIRAMARPELREHRLLVLGEGPLLPAMIELAEHEGVTGRVRFAGAVMREEAIAAMSVSRLLVHPSSREGSPWVVGEAAAVGLAAVVMPGSGAEATVRLSANGGVVAPVAADEVDALMAGIVEALSRPQPAPSDRWSAARLPALLDAWYSD